jgi:uncharacterized membrane protein YkgB
MKDLDVRLSKLSIFIVYFWFGALKVTGDSPANELVLSLLDKTMPAMEPSLFLMLFGLFEMLIGILILTKKFERAALTLLSLHIIMILAPLALLADMTWQSFLVPTMEGQYILKNVLIIAAAVNIANGRRKTI